MVSNRVEPVGLEDSCGCGRKPDFSLAVQQQLPDLNQGPLSYTCNYQSWTNNHFPAPADTSNNLSSSTTSLYSGRSSRYPGICTRTRAVQRRHTHNSKKPFIQFKEAYLTKKPLDDYLGTLPWETELRPSCYAIWRWPWDNTKWQNLSFENFGWELRNCHPLSHKFSPH